MSRYPISGAAGGTIWQFNESTKRVFSFKSSSLSCPSRLSAAAAVGVAITYNDRDRHDTTHRKDRKLQID